ncbi:response regulator [Oerskovia rustica]|uniref:Response regulator transcription factor n=1 Tax=Oerskovia rustica TaxID=2762237 RepID=A0ABR8RP00_9CELL|nr:response regulator transcription factor [Oerskovia rustica]MBD7949511.1 response regulator transcription factor [Oerskovia rustica]
MTRVVVVDDESLFREGMAALVDAADDLDVVGTAANGRLGVEAVIARRPDVVLMDMQMPVMNGIEATQEIRRVAPEVAVVILTNFQYDEYVVPALRAGAAGYLLKDSTVSEVQRGIRAAAEGDAMLSPAVTRRLLDSLGPAMTTRQAEARARVGELSERERAVVGLLATGLSNAEIARALYMAEPTVKTHLTHAMVKLGVTNRTQAAILGHDAGLPDEGAG